MLYNMSIDNWAEVTQALTLSSLIGRNEYYHLHHCRTEFHKLRFIGTSKAKFSCLIETSNDMVEVFKEVGLGEKSYNA